MATGEAPKAASPADRTTPNDLTGRTGQQVVADAIPKTGEPNPPTAARPFTAHDLPALVIGRTPPPEAPGNPGTPAEPHTETAGGVSLTTNPDGSRTYKPRD